MGEMNEEILLTREGLEKIKNELQYLKTVRRKEIAERIKSTRKYGDISENSEYDDAKNEQAFVEGRIKDLEQILRNAKLIEENNDSEDINTVRLGATVKLEDMESGESFTYTLVGSAEADPSENRISNESPVGQAIIGKKEGDVVEVEVPVGKIAYKITQVGKKNSS